MQWRRWLFTFIFCFSIFGLLSFTKFTQIKAAIAFGESFPEASETVHSQQVEFSQWQPSLKLNAEIKATRNLEIRNELEGMISRVGFASASQVKAGDILIQLDVSVEQAELEGIQAEIKIAQLDVNRFEKLLQQNASSRDQLDRARAQLDVAKSREVALRTRIAKKTLRAPFDGYTDLHQLEVGGFLPANTVVTRILGALDTVWVDFYVPQQYSALNIGQQITVTSDKLPTGSAVAHIDALAQSISSQSRNLLVRAKLEQSEAALMPGELVQVNLPINTPREVVQLPTVAIRHDAFGSYVFLLNKDNDDAWRAQRQVVEIVSSQDKTSIVSAGLNRNDMVATLGSYKLREGMLVNVAETVEAQ